MEKKSRVQVTSDSNSDQPIHVYKIKAETETKKKEDTVALFTPTSDTVKTYTEQLEGKEIYSLENEYLKLSSAPDFFPNLYSLKYKGEEWLDHSFPSKAK